MDVGVMINDHLRGEGGRVFIKELHDSHVGRCLQKTSAWHVNVLRILYTSWKEATPPRWHSYGRYGQVQVGRNSS